MSACSTGTRIRARYVAALAYWVSASVLLLAVAALAEEPRESPPLLTLDSAVQLAVANNRSVQIARLEIDKTRWSIESAKTKRLPAFHTYAFGSALLTPFSYTFDQGVFGNINGTPIPNQTTKIENGQSFNVYLVAQAAQPLSQLYKINLGIHLQKLDYLYSSESYRAKRQSVVNEVKQTYYQMLQTQSGLEATAASIKQYEELDRVVTQYVSLQTALKSESMEVKARLAQEQYNMIKLRNNLAIQKEQLNDLMGRDLETDFRLEEVPGITATESDLKLAQQTALTQRPEIRQAEINVEKADYDRRLAKADYIPDVGVALHYISPFNIAVVPQNITAAGIELSWEPFDWGRRKDNINQKKIVVEQSTYQLKEVRAKVLRDVNARFRKLEESRALLQVAMAKRDAVQEKLREVTDKFHQESVLFRDVLQQQAAVANANHEYEQGLLDFWNAKAEFEKALGED